VRSPKVAIQSALSESAALRYCRVFFSADFENVEMDTVSLILTFRYARTFVI
jgi:hypothetical protein